MFSAGVLILQDMNHACFFSRLIFILLSGLGYTGFAQLSRPLRIMTYNILNGFEWGKEPGRQDSLGKWVLSRNPDVVALQELCGFTEEKLLQMAQSWGHGYSVLLKEEGYPVGLSSKTPIKVKAKMLGGLWHGMLHVETAGVDFLVVHLSPSDRQFRMKEARILRDYIETVVMPVCNHYIVLGDFNAHSPFDAGFDRKQGVLERVRTADSQNEKYKNLLHNEFDYGVISVFLSAPLIDVIARFITNRDRWSYPSSKWTGPPMPNPAMNKERLDYILVSPSLAPNCTGTFIYNSGLTDRLSDHFPVVAEFGMSTRE